MVERLRARSAEFAEGWDSHHVAFQQFGTRVLNHPQVGRLAIDFHGLQPIGHDRIRIVVYTAADDAESSGRLARLLNPGPPQVELGRDRPCRDLVGGPASSTSGFGTTSGGRTTRGAQ